jgi:hypothetical protein
MSRSCVRVRAMRYAMSAASPLPGGCFIGSESKANQLAAPAHALVAARDLHKRLLADFRAGRASRALPPSGSRNFPPLWFPGVGHAMLCNP